MYPVLTLYLLVVFSFDIASVTNEALSDKFCCLWERLLVSTTVFLFVNVICVQTFPSVSMLLVSFSQSRVPFSSIHIEKLLISLSESQIVAHIKLGSNTTGLVSQLGKELVDFRL